MNDSHPDPELDALFARARAHRPDTSTAEFAFETRLLARLRAERETGSIWALVSWRLIPLFAAGVLALTIWQAQVASEASDSMSLAALNNPVASELGDN